ALKSGVIDTVGTDHCPFTQEQKNRGRNDFREIPNGAGGVEHRLNLLYTYGVLAEKISIGQFVALTSANAAKIFGMFSGKGTIEKGADADVVIWNPETEKTISADTHCSNCDLDIYEGFKITGAPEIVIRNGIIVKENNNLTDNLRPGRLLKTNPL
ncbi:MAG: dihydropyrimidinase, partial [Bacteroidetes bacterium]